MKRLYVIFALIMLSTVSFAQYRVTPKGLMSESGNSSEVYAFKGLSKESLYESALKYATKTFVSPQDEISTKGDALTITALMEIKGDNAFLKSSWIYTTLYLECEDGRITVGMPEISRIISGIGPAEFNMHFVQTNNFLPENGIYTTKGKLRYPIMKGSIEDVLNGFVESLCSYVKANAR